MSLVTDSVFVVHRQPTFTLMQAFDVRANCVYRHKTIGLRGLHELLRGFHELLHLRFILLLLRLLRLLSTQ